jgi:putative endonuclease
MSKYRQQLGRWGEDLAVKFLVDEGYLILDRNVRTPYGEIDIIAMQSNLIVFVEVKTRSTTNLGMPEESVTLKKQKHMIDAIEFYNQDHPYPDYDWRIDVIAIRLRKNEITPEIIHFQNAIMNG